MAVATGIRGRRRAPAPAAVVAVACLLVALASLLLRAGPQYDPIGWLLWGRQVLHGDLNTVWYPSWKPLPVLVTAPASLAGRGALPLWVLTERAVALAGVVVGARIAWRAGGGPLAAVLAAAGIVLMPLWLQLWLAGTIEPVVAALLLGAVAAALARRDAVALLLLALAALGRIDAWPLLALAVLWCWWRGSARIVGPALAAVVPALWLAGDWAGSGDPMRGGFLAKIAAPTDPGVPPVHAVLHHVPELVPLPVLAVAVATAVWAIARRRPAETMLAAVAVVWLVADLVLAWRNYPTDLRFLLPPGAAVVTLAAIGAGRVLAALSDRRVAAALVAAAVAAAVVVRAPTVHDDIAQDSVAMNHLEQLDRAVDWAGGARMADACGGAATIQPFRARLAWDLGRPTAAVVTVGRHGLVFVPPGPRASRLPVRRRVAVRLHRVARVAGWTILSVAPSHGAPRAACRPGPPRARGAQLQRSVSGASRIRSMRAGTPPTTAFSGTSPVTTA